MLHVTHIRVSCLPGYAVLQQDSSLELETPHLLFCDKLSKLIHVVSYAGPGTSHQSTEVLVGVYDTRCCPCLVYCVCVGVEELCLA